MPTVDAEIYVYAFAHVSKCEKLLVTKLSRFDKNASTRLEAFQCNFVQHKFKLFGMARITIILCSLTALLCLSARGTRACGKNEQLGNCGRICEGTCNNPDLAKCAATNCSGNGCQCKVGYLRNEDTDQCIPASMCPPKTCKGNEVLAKCGRKCEGTCENPRTPEICSRIKCASEDCICDLDSGYVRHKKTGKCIAVRDCRHN